LGGRIAEGKGGLAWEKGKRVSNVQAAENRRNPEKSREGREAAREGFKRVGRKDEKRRGKEITLSLPQGGADRKDEEGGGEKGKEKKPRIKP